VTSSKWYKTDTLPDLEFTIKQDGSAVDLTGATVKFYMKNRDTGNVKINGVACTLVVAASGTCKYVWQSGDTDTVGTFVAEVEVTFSGGTVQTGYENLTIEIRDDI